MRKIRFGVTQALLILLDLLFVAGVPHALAKTKYKDPERSRAEYIARLQSSPAAQTPIPTTGSLWVPGSLLSDLAADYKAHNVGDTIQLLVSLQTTAQSAGDVNQQRSFQTSSAITALPGELQTAGVNPLFGANSATQLQGKGESDNSSTLVTNLSARVIAVLPNQNMVVEAERAVFMNNQHETMFVRGVLRPGDIGPNNTAASTSLANLEIELKGKGVISDSVSRPNPIMRAILWLIGF